MEISKLSDYASRLYGAATCRWLFNDEQAKKFTKCEQYLFRHHVATDILATMLINYDLLTGHAKDLVLLLITEKSLVEYSGLGYIILNRLYMHRDAVKNKLKDFPGHLKNKLTQLYNHS